MSAVPDRARLAYLSAGRFIDSEHPLVVEFSDAHRGGSPDRREQVVSLYYAIRDGFTYSPWGASGRPDDYRASAVLSRTDRTGHCIDKAVVLAACARHLGVPARLRFANVRNHIGTESLERFLGTNLLVFHGYCELHFGDEWVAATPAFNRQLCERLGVAALDFDGHTDAIFQEYDARGGRFMEYVHDYGSFDDIPFELMIGEWHRHYPRIAESGWPKRPR